MVEIGRKSKVGHELNPICVVLGFVSPLLAKSVSEIVYFVLNRAVNLNSFSWFQNISLIISSVLSSLSSSQILSNFWNDPVNKQKTTDKRQWKQTYA